MGNVSTDIVLSGPWNGIENHQGPGTFGIMNRDPAQSIIVTMIGPAGGETIELVHPGDACQFDLKGITAVSVAAGSGTYPTNVTVNYSNLDIRLMPAPYLAGGDPNNPVPVTAVGIETGTVDPSAGAGIPATPGTVYGRDNAGSGELWLKTGAADTAWTQVTVP